MAKRTATKRTAAVAREVYTSKDAIDFLMTIPDIQESFTRADIELAIDDQGYERFGANIRNITDIDQTSRNIIISKSRLYWMRDPLAKQSVRLWTDYSIGTGITFQAKSPDVQTKLTQFVSQRRNKKIMSKQGQQRSSKKLLIDGDVYFAIFGAEGEDKIIRYLEPLQITRTINDPDDDERPLAYKRLTADNKTLYYADWAAGDDGKALAEKQKDPDNGRTVVLQEDVVVYHVPFDSIYNRGNGLLSTVLEYTSQHRRFIAARVAIVQALSKFATKTTVKGGQNVLNSIKSRLESTLAQTGTQGGAERQPPPAPGGNWLQNAGIDLQAMPRATGAGDARDDSDNLKLMVAAGTNIMLHYFGDPSTGNLATATAMELPMLKSFGGYQELWKDAYRDLFAIVLDEDPEAEEVEVIDIDLPPILDADLAKLGAYIAQISTPFPEVKIPEVLQMLLIALGINNLDEVMKVIAAKREELDAQQAELQKMQAQTPPMTPAQQATIKESYDRLATSIAALAGKL